jgi:hypothetical protein
MPPLKHRSSSHTSTTKQGDAVQSHAYKDDDRPDTFNTLGPTPVELGKKKGKYITPRPEVFPF